MQGLIQERDVIDSDNITLQHEKDGDSEIITATQEDKYENMIKEISKIQSDDSI